MGRLLADRTDNWLVLWPATIVALVVARTVLPGSYGDYVLDVAVLGTIFAIGAIGLNVQFGFTGLLNFGHVLSLMIGAYTTALVILELGWAWGWAMLFGASVAAVVGVVVGLFSLRLRTDYLAIVTIALAEMVRLIIKNSGSFRVDAATGSQERVGTGGVFGVQNFAGGFNDTLEAVLPFLDSREWRLFGFNATIITVALLVTWSLRRAPWGRAQRAIKEDEDVTSALGKRTAVLKLQSFAVGAFIGAFAGVALAMQNNFIDTETWLPIVTFRMWIAMILGGAGTIFGPVIGALVLQGIFSVVRFLPRIQATPAFDWIPEAYVSADRLGALQGQLLGLIIVLIIMFRPQGLAGRSEEVGLGRSG